jgi:hypothetical protein
MSPHPAARQRSAEETVMTTNAPVEETRVTFPNQLTSMAGILFTPAGLDKTKRPDTTKPFSQREWCEIPGATHHRLYDLDADKAIPKLEEFFGRNL